MNERDEQEPKMGVFHRIGSFFALHEDVEEPYEDEPEAAPRKVVAFSRENRRPGPEVALFAPRSFGDVTEIADALRARQVVIVNLQSADRALLQRVVDFTSGVAYPDCLLLDAKSLSGGATEIRAAGYFGGDWSVEAGEFAWRE